MQVISAAQTGKLAFGTMSLGGTDTDEAESFRTLDAAQAAGLGYFDSANIYGMGRAETVLGKWLRARGLSAGQGPAIATKAGILPGPPRGIANGAAYLEAELDASLRRLGRDHVDLFYLHRYDLAGPIEPVIDTMARLIAAGKIGGYGLSEVSPATLRRAHAVHPCSAVQNEYSLWTRQPDLGMIQATAALGVAFVAFSPLGRGMFSDLPLAPPQDPFRSRNPRFTGENFARNLSLVAELRAYAHAREWHLPALALAWVMAQGAHVIALPGTRHALRLQEWLQASNRPLDAKDRAALARLAPPGFAHGARYGQEHLLGVEIYG